MGAGSSEKCNSKPHMHTAKSWRVWTNINRKCKPLLEKWAFLKIFNWGLIFYHLHFLSSPPSIPTVRSGRTSPGMVQGLIDPFHTIHNVSHVCLCVRRCHFPLGLQGQPDIWHIDSRWALLFPWNWVILLTGRLIFALQKWPQMPSRIFWISNLKIDRDQTSKWVDKYPKLAM